MQDAGKQDDQQKAPPENRHRIPNERDAHQALIEDRATFDSSNDAGWNANDNCQENRTEGKFNRRREQCEELAENR
ncbi:hypothetical protein D3C80_1971640 [compost metagenome]